MEDEYIRGGPSLAPFGLLIVIGIAGFWLLAWLSSLRAPPKRELNAKEKNSGVRVFVEESRKHAHENNTKLVRAWNSRNPKAWEDFVVQCDYASTLFHESLFTKEAAEAKHESSLARAWGRWIVHSHTPDGTVYFLWSVKRKRTEKFISEYEAKATERSQ